MKVGVDSVLLGSWADFSDASTVIDIGTGTGLLALMAAQKSKAEISAIEIDENSAKQAQENFNLSPWKNRIKLKQTSFQNFVSQTDKKYDIAICNPPYFNNTYQSPDKSRNIARQNNTLPLPDLFSGTKKILSQSGKLYIIYPYLQKDILLQEAANHRLYPQKALKIKPYQNKIANRIIICFANNKAEIKTGQLIVKNKQTGAYCPEYKKLTKEFYLNF